MPLLAPFTMWIRAVCVWTVTIYPLNFFSHSPSSCRKFRLDNDVLLSLSLLMVALKKLRVLPLGFGFVSVAGLTPVASAGARLPAAQNAPKSEPAQNVPRGDTQGASRRPCAYPVAAPLDILSRRYRARGGYRSEPRVLAHHELRSSRLA